MKQCCPPLLAMNNVLLYPYMILDKLLIIQLFCPGFQSLKLNEPEQHTTAAVCGCYAVSLIQDSSLK